MSLHGTEYLEYKKVRFSKIPSEEIKKILTILDESSKKMYECYHYPDPDLQLSTISFEQKGIIFLSVAEIFVALLMYIDILPASAIWIVLGIPLFIGLWVRITGECGIIGALLNKTLDMLFGEHTTLPPEIKSISSQMEKLYKDFEEVYKLCQYSEQLKSFLEEKGKDEKLSFYLDTYGCMYDHKNIYVRKNGCKESMYWRIDDDMYDRIFSDKNLDFGKTHRMLEDCFERLHQMTQNFG